MQRMLALAALAALACAARSAAKPIDGTTGSHSAGAHRAVVLVCTARVHELTR
jgi:hypothetical protein